VTHEALSLLQGVEVVHAVISMSVGLDRDREEFLPIKEKTQQFSMD
jgi:hypothetical protein